MDQDKITDSVKTYMKQYLGCDNIRIGKCSKTQSCCSPLYQCFALDEEHMEPYHVIMDTEYNVIHCMSTATKCW